ncbi:MAG: coiled-coil domain-containing protein [Solirubrobacteraceae bacterium]
MSLSIRFPALWRAFAVSAAVAAALLASDLTARSAGDLQSQIAAGQSTATTLQSQITADTARIQATTHGLQDARSRLATIQAKLSSSETQLSSAQTELLHSRNHLVELENRLQRTSHALAANLRANYEGSAPDVMSVILNARGFSDLLEQMSFLQRIGHQDARVLGNTRTARRAVARQATELAALEQRDRTLTDQVLARRNQAAALEAALLTRQIAQTGARAGKTARLDGLQSRLKALEAKAAAQAAAAARAASVTTAPSVSLGPVGASTGGPVAVNSGGIVQPPAGAPAAIGQVMAAGNAIATLPYVWGGGHGSFQANGYDCSGSVSYALAAAGLLSSPLDSTGFESWGDPGPGRWITVYANAGHAFMIVAGWRFDTVALAEGGTRWSSNLSGEDTSGFVARHPPGL